MKPENWFEYKGIRSTDMGLIIKGERTLGSAERDIEFQSIPGRSGDLIIDNGRYTNFEESFNCGLLPVYGRNTEEQSKYIKSWLQSSFSYEQFRIWTDPNYVRMGVCISKVDISKTLSDWGNALVIFSFKPYKYLLTGLETITITSSISIFNPENFESQPYLKIYGDGDVSLYINNQTISIEGIDEYIEIDSEMKNAYKDTQPLNNQLKSDFPVFETGENAISWTGSVSKIEIIPRWVTLA